MDIIDALDVLYGMAGRSGLYLHAAGPVGTPAQRMDEERTELRRAVAVLLAHPSVPAPALPSISHNLTQPR